MNDDFRFLRKSKQLSIFGLPKHFRSVSGSVFLMSESEMPKTEPRPKIRNFSASGKDESVSIS